MDAPQSRAQRSALLVVQRFAHQMELSTGAERFTGSLQDFLENPLVVLRQVAGHDHQIRSRGERVGREIPRMGGDPILHSPLGYQLPRHVADGREVEDDRLQVGPRSRINERLLMSTSLANSMPAPRPTA